MNTLFPKYSKRQDGCFTIMEQKLLKQVNNLVQDNSKCTGCGICSESCPEEAISIGPVGAYRRGAIEYGSPIQVDETKCSYCGVCVVMCPFNAMSLEIDGEAKLPLLEKEGFPVYDMVTEIDHEKCAQCTTCEDVCPREAIIRDVPLFEGTDIFGLKKAEAVNANTEFTCNDEKCTYCGLCGEVCQAIDVIRKPFTPETGVLDGEVVWNKDFCDGCQICQSICPNEAIEVKRGKIEKKLNNDGLVEIETEECCTCRWCAISCPTEAITVNKIFEGEITFNPSKCPGGCSTCYEVCPANAIYMPTPKAPADMHNEVEAKIAVNKDFCVLCGACVNSCPSEDAIVLKRTAVHMKGKKTDLFKKIEAKLLVPRTSKVREDKDVFGKAQVKAL
ncbi:MAG: 4Fe-4S binding protein [Methanomicrobium sp.]|nr:4Fe-4S binding protein [Methanomicrobium sp.]